VEESGTKFLHVMLVENVDNAVVIASVRTTMASSMAGMSTHYVRVSLRSVASNSMPDFKTEKKKESAFGQ
jgi:hypothetical protein